MTDIVEPFALVFEVFWSGNGVLLAGQKFCKGGQRHSLPIIFNTSITNNCCGYAGIITELNFSTFGYPTLAEGKIGGTFATLCVYLLRHLFRLLFMRNRSQEEVTRQLGDDAEPLLDLIQRAAGLSRESARLFHLEMWIYVHGIASMAATSFLDWDTELISASLTDVYMGVLARFKEKEAQK